PGAGLRRLGRRDGPAGRGAVRDRGRSRDRGRRPRRRPRRRPCLGQPRRRAPRPHDRAGGPLMATVFAHGQLRLYLLALLDAGPKHGYELITELSDRFGGTYRPSAGTIYPRLARLEDEGLVHRSADGRKTTYELTPAGRAESEARRAGVAALEHGIAETVRQRAEALRESGRASSRDRGPIAGDTGS